MRTPWGESDHEIKFKRGVTWVNTPGHGGFMIGKKVAEKFLTESARKRGNSFGATWPLKKIAIMQWSCSNILN